MNILVTGANGQLGHEMQICAKNSNHKFVFTDVAEGYEKLDITNLDAIREKVRENDIQVIVNCAAYTNVDKAETDKKVFFPNIKYCMEKLSDSKLKRIYLHSPALPAATFYNSLKEENSTSIWISKDKVETVMEKEKAKEAYILEAQ